MKCYYSANHDFHDLVENFTDYPKLLGTQYLPFVSK